MVPDHYPGWLLKRARESKAKRIYAIHPGKTSESPCVYVLDLPGDIIELHVAEDGEHGVEAAALHMTRREASDFIGRFVGALTGREIGITLPTT